MTASRLALVLEAAAQLDRELTKVLGHADVLATSCEPSTVVSLRGVLGQVSSTMRSLRERVLASAGEIDADDQEATLRARIGVVVTQLAELRDAEPEVSPDARLFDGRFRRVHDLRRHVLDRIGRINAAWLKERRSIETNATDPGAARRTLRAALDTAERAFAAIGGDPDLITFLGAGASASSERFCLACRLMLFVLDVPITREIPALPQLPRRSGPGVAGARSTDVGTNHDVECRTTRVHCASERTQPTSRGADKGGT